MTVAVATEAPHYDSTSGLGDQLADRNQRLGAAATCAIFAIVAALSAWLGLAQGPQIKLLLPVTATIWSCADLLTGYVLVGQFCFTRRLSFAVLGVAYMLGGYLTWAYSLTFPGFNLLYIRTLGDQNIFVYAWMIWHWSFPMLVVASVVIDSSRRRTVDAHAVRIVALLTILTPLVLTCLSMVIVYIERDHLPYLVIGGELQPLDRLWFQPAIFILNAGAISMLLARHKRLTTLHLWLAAAMFAVCLDTVLIALSAKIYSYAWDVGKLLSVATAGTVLVMILEQVVNMYRRQFAWTEVLETEVTERKRAEVMLERAAIAARAAKIGIWQWDAISDARTWDDTLLAIFGRRKPVDPIDTQFFLSSLHPDDRERVFKTYTAATADEIDQEYRVVADNGEVRHIHSRGAIVRAQDGSILRMTGAAWDVTDLRSLTNRLQAEKDRLAAANRLMSMAEQLARVGHWRVDLGTNEVFWSDEVYRTHGLAPGNPPSVETAIAAYHPEDREVVQDCVRQAIMTGEPYTFESRLLRPDGTVRYVVSSGQVERDTSGNIAALFGVFQDVTDVRNAEREQGRLLERVTLAAQAGQVGIWEWDIRSGISTWDSDMFELYGFAACPVHETTLRFFEALHPDDLERVKLANINARAGVAPYDLEFRVIWPSGDVRHIRARAKVFYDTAGTPVRMIGTNWDVTDVRRVESSLRASEERFRQVEEHTPVGLALVGLDDSIIRANPAFCALTGYSNDELLSRSRASLTHPDDLKRDRERTRELLDGIIELYQHEKRYLHKDGRVVWALVSVSVVRDDAGKPLYVIGQILDVTARKAAEAELAAAQSVAMIATEAKARFIATMSHEIRTPMNGVIGMTELLSLSELTEEQHENVKVIRDSGRSLLRVIDDILDYSKIESGKLDLDIQSFSVQSQVASVLALFRSQYENKGVLLTTRVDTVIPAFLRGDPGRVRQVLINLAGNALKFTPKAGTVRILIEHEPSVGPGTAVRFTVVDTGIGIAPEVRHRLFQPFSQVDSSTSRKYGGTGLGLSICKQLVEIMGGQISVTSKLGTGSAFSFVIPFALSDGTESDAVSRPALYDRRALVRRRSEKVLLAEDNEVNALVAIRQFDRLGFDLVVVGNGIEAVKAVQHQRFDLVFMDCHMPHMDGFDATRAIRSLNSLRNCIPIIALTANAQAEDREQCRAAGMDDHVAKPVTLANLGAILERWLPSSIQEVGPVRG